MQIDVSVNGKELIQVVFDRKGRGLGLRPPALVINWSLHKS